MRLYKFSLALILLIFSYENSSCQTRFEKQANDNFNLFVNKRSQNSNPDLTSLNEAKKTIDKAWNNENAKRPLSLQLLRFNIELAYSYYHHTPNISGVADSLGNLIETASAGKVYPYLKTLIDYGKEQCSIYYSTYGGINFNKGNYKLAFEQYSCVAYYRPDDTIAILGAANAAYNASMADPDFARRAIPMYERLLTHHISDSVTDFNDLGHLYIIDRDTEKAVQSYLKGFICHPVKEDLLGAARFYAVQQREAHAFIKTVDSLLREHNNNKWLYYDQAFAYYELDDSLRVLVNRAITRRKAQGLINQQLAMNAEAEKNCLKAVKLDSSDPNILSLYSVILLRKALDYYNWLMNGAFTKKNYQQHLEEVDQYLDDAYPFLKKSQEQDLLSEIAKHNLNVYYDVHAEIHKSGNFSKRDLMMETPLAHVNGIDLTPPVLTITGPKLPSSNRIEYDSGVITVSGTVADSSGVYTVLVNKAEAHVTPDGKFSKNVILGIGDNTIAVKAVDNAMNSIEKKFIVHRESTVPQQPEIQVPVSQVAAEGNFYAVLVGVQQYADKNIDTLSEPDHDARSLAGILSSRYSFTPQHVKVLTDVAKEQFFDVLDSLATRLTDRDNLLIFFAGHGSYDPMAQQGYWEFEDAKQGKKVTWLSNSDLKDEMLSFKTRHILIISDACFSGSIMNTRGGIKAAPKEIRMLYDLPSRKAISSGLLESVPDKSVFFDQLRQFLQSNTQPAVTAGQLFETIKPAIIRDSPNHQIPQYGIISGTNDQGGEFVFLLRD